MSYWKVIDAHEQAWDAWVAKCPNADVYHYAGFVCSMNTDTNAQPKLLVFECQYGIVVHPLLFRPLESIDKQFAGFFDVTTCYGYGGPAWYAVDNKENELLTFYWQEEEIFLRSQGVVSEFIRIHPLIAPCKVLEGQPMLVTRSHTVAMDLAVSPEEQWNTLSKNHRRNINKAQKAGLTVAFHDQPDNTLIDTFGSIYNLTMSRLNASDAYYFPQSCFQGLFKRLPYGMAWLCLAYHKNEIVAAFLNLAGHSFFHYHLGASSDKARDLGANHFLMFESARFSREQEYKKMHLGGGYSRDDGLTRYKEGFGCDIFQFQTLQRILLPEIYHTLCLFVGFIQPEKVSFFPAYRSVPERE